MKDIKELVLKRQEMYKKTLSKNEENELQELTNKITHFLSENAKEAQMIGKNIIIKEEEQIKEKTPNIRGKKEEIKSMIEELKQNPRNNDKEIIKTIVKEFGCSTTYVYKILRDKI